MTKSTRTLSQSLMCLGLLLAGSVICTGCQSSIGGQTLPSAYYMQDDIQYFPRGPEFKLAREAAALKAAREQRPEPRR